MSGIFGRAPQDADFDPAGFAVVPPTITGPLTDLSENFGAAYRQAFDLDTYAGLRSQMGSAYDRMIDAVGGRARLGFGSGLRNPAWVDASERDAQEQNLFAAVEDLQHSDPKRAAGLPRNRAELEDQVRADRARELQETSDIMGRGLRAGGGTMRFLGSVAGGTLGEPAQAVTLPVGGWGTNAAMRIGTEALQQGAIAGTLVPGHAAVRRFDNRPYGAAEIAQEVGGAVVFGGLFRAGGEVLHAAGPKLHPVFRAIVGRESGGRADAIGPETASGDRAIGIGQIMPGTARDVAAATGRQDIAGLPEAELTERLKDPALNAELGNAYFEQQLQAFGGDQAKAIAAYHAGPANVRAYEKAAEAKFGPDYTTEQFLQTVEESQAAATARHQAAGEPSFNDTASYVRNVMGDADAGRPITPDRLASALRRADEAGGLPPTARGAEQVLQAEADRHNSNPFAGQAAAIRAHLTALDEAENAVTSGQPMPELEPAELDPALFDYGRPSTSIVGLRPSQLGVDAKRMQFKAGGDAEGVTERLRGVREWDPIRAGVLLAWQDEGGKLWVADGHQRIGLARRLEAEGQAVTVESRILRAADGFTAEDARMIAAAKNIAEGTGTAIDAAKVLRVRPEVLKNLPPNSALVRTGRDLLGLHDEAFGAVVNGLVPEEHAALVGRLARDHDASVQLGIIGLLREAEPENMRQAETLVRDALSAGAESIKQESLFGEMEVSVPLIVERSKILDAAVRRLKRDRALFNAVVKEAGRLGTEGNVLAGSRNASRAEADAELIGLIEKLATRKGPISDALSDAARERVRGSISRESAGERFVGAVIAHARSGTLDGLGARAGERLALARPESGAQPEPRVPAPSPDQAARLEGFDDPAGEAAAAQADTIERELRGEKPIAAEAAIPIRLENIDGTVTTGELTPAAILEEIDNQADFMAMLDTCLAPPKKAEAAE
jgi:hypothetical protein